MLLLLTSRLCVLFGELSILSLLIRVATSLRGSDRKTGIRWIPPGLALDRSEYTHHVLCMCKNTSGHWFYELRAASDVSEAEKQGSHR